MSYSIPGFAQEQTPEERRLWEQAGVSMSKTVRAIDSAKSAWPRGLIVEEPTLTAHQYELLECYLLGRYTHRAWGTFPMPQDSPFWRKRWNEIVRSLSDSR